MTPSLVPPPIPALPMRCLAPGCVLLIVFGGAVRAAWGEAALDTAVGTFLQQYCVRCHTAEKAEGKFRIDALSRDFVDLSAAQKWAELITRINAGEMPPEEEKQPSIEEVAQVVDLLSIRIKEGEAARMARRGRVAHYRLSREEYANTIYDLLGVHFDAERPGAFNEEPRWHGFERIGSMLSLSPSHVDRYFQAAEAILERAFPPAPPAPKKDRRDAIALRHGHQREKLNALGVADKVRAVVWPGSEVGVFQSHAPSESGRYRARIQLSGLRPPGGLAPHLAIWDQNLKRTIYDEDILAPEDQPILVEFETFLSMPVGLSIRNDVAGAIPEGHTRNVLMSENYFLGTRDTRFLNPTAYKLTDDQGQALYPLLLVDWVEWEGPLSSDADRKKLEGLFPAAPGDPAEVRACLQRFATRAWRRPASPAQIERYAQVVAGEMSAGENFRSAYLAALTGILTSKNFYYLEEGSPLEARGRVDDWELASRLSYFLWSSMPDDELFAAAQAGQLHEPEVLRAQTARMTADPKIERFTKTFPRQWLQLHRLGMFPPDAKLYPDYDKWLEQSMQLETLAYFREVYTQNLPLAELLSSNWTMVNPRLALHYQLPPVTQSGMQRVALRPEDHRGGLLTQAAILSLTSDGTRHRPVHRGVWVSEAIFGRTPPSPPPNVEPLAPTPADQPKATVRMQLEAHATHATCASCHRKIDPLGFAFENYDAIGRWRTAEQATTGQGANPAVDARGALADGRKFDGPEEFKQLLAADLDRFAEAFVEQLATFALRRAMTVDDAEQIRAIAHAGKADQYRLRNLVERFVSSDLFQKR